MTEYESVSVCEEPARPAKRLKTRVTAARKSLVEDEPLDAVPPHPLGIKPSGNAFTAEVNLKSHAGLFGWLPDELIAHLLEYLEGRELLRLGHTCKALYAFCFSDDLWKSIFIRSCPQDFEWCGSWRSTHLHFPSSTKPAFDCSGLYSDVLYRPFQCAHTSFKPYILNIPRHHEIPRFEDLSQEQYTANWASKPFILTFPVKQWPIYGKWSTDYLLHKYPKISVIAEAVNWPLKTYVDYMNNQHDESPLYLFDRTFAEKLNLRIGSSTDNDHKDLDYWAPSCFGEDLFSLLGAQRPDSRWLIVGPARSGSTFHADPNATSAWNAVLIGRKYWLMFPAGPNTPPPPGVILSADRSEVTSPVSIAEYVLAFHEMARATPGCKEGICDAGEVLHVPSGWYHFVLNLEESIAITQNFVPRKKLVDVLRFLRDCPEQVSGFSEDITDPYVLFVERLKEKYPELLEEALQKLNGKSKWEEIKQVNDEGAGSGGFSFGFGEDDYDDVEVP